MRKLIIIMLVLILGLISSAIGSAERLTGDLSVGYYVTDDENNQSLMYERYNNYDGASVSLNNLLYIRNGIFYKADLQNIPLNNRNLFVSVYKPTKFNLSARYNKFRRIYDTDESYSTKRELTEVSTEYSINKNFQFFGSFTNSSNKGSRLYITEDLIDSLVSFIDYSSQTASGGISYSSQHGNFATSYIYTTYDDNDTLYIQKTDQINFNGNLKVPGADSYRLFGGFTYVKNKLDNLNFNQINYHGWVGTKKYFKKQIVLEYRFLYNRNDHEAKQIETDNWHHLVSVSKRWKSKFGLRVGYDYIIADDLLNRTKRNGYLVNGWARFNKQVYMKFETNFYDKKTDLGSTLFGTTSFNRNKFSITYTPKTELILSGSYISRYKENESLLSKVDYSKFGGNITYQRENIGKICLNVSYSEGDYKNQSTTSSYLFNNMYVGGMIAPYISEKLALKFKGSYYNLEKDTDFRKIILGCDVSYELYKEISLDITFNSFNAEDYLLDDEYTGHLIGFNLVKHFEK